MLNPDRETGPPAIAKEDASWSIEWVCRVGKRNCVMTELILVLALLILLVQQLGLRNK
jgi:hypothetical protein